MKWPRRVFLIRHGQSARNVQKDQAKLQGNNAQWITDGIRDQDTPLTAKGKAQATATALALVKEYGEFGISHLIISPYLRTRETAKVIESYFPYLHMDGVVVEERIREVEFGMMDGLTRQYIKEHYPTEYDRKLKEGKYYYRPPGGENRPDVAMRCHSFLGTLKRDYADASVAIICHSVVVLVFRRLLERWTEEQYLQVDKENDVLNCSVTCYEKNRDEADKLILQYYNSIRYSKDLL